MLNLFAKIFVTLGLLLFCSFQAVYFFLRDYQDTVTEVPYDGEYDDMLFLFKFMHEKIHTLYK